MLKSVLKITACELKSAINEDISKILMGGFKGSLEEATQEMTTQALSNWAAQETYDKTRNLFEGFHPKSSRSD